MGSFDFSRLANIEVRTNVNNWFLPGAYNVRVMKVWLKTNYMGEQFFIIEGEILSSSNSAIKTGEIRAHTQNIKKPGALQSVKQFIIEAALAAKLVDSRDVFAALTEEQWGQLGATVTGEGNELRGAEMTLLCEEVDTRTGGKYTKHVWRAA